MSSRRRSSYVTWGQRGRRHKGLEVINASPAIQLFSCFCRHKVSPSISFRAPLRWAGKACNLISPKGQHSLIYSLAVRTVFPRRFVFILRRAGRRRPLHRGHRTSLTLTEPPAGECVFLVCMRSHSTPRPPNCSAVLFSVVPSSFFPCFFFSCRSDLGLIHFRAVKLGWELQPIAPKPVSFAPSQTGASTHPTATSQRTRASHSDIPNTVT